jgi:hypothetical protein
VTPAEKNYPRKSSAEVIVSEIGLCDTMAVKLLQRLKRMPSRLVIGLAALTAGLIAFKIFKKNKLSRLR